jgi:hypothetical protein
MQSFFLKSPLLALPLGALGLFLLVFVVACVRALLRPEKYSARLAALPLDSDKESVCMKVPYRSQASIEQRQRECCGGAADGPFGLGTAAGHSATESRGNTPCAGPACSFSLPRFGGSLFGHRTRIRNQPPTRAPGEPS